MPGDALDHSVAFLKQRDGLDKTLKLMRYVSAIAAYNILADDPSSVTGTKLRKLDKSTGITRKYLKLGKFLGNLKELRALLRAGEIASRPRSAQVGNRTPDLALASAATFANRLNIASQLAQLVYNFAEQLNWAAKIGLIRNKRRRRNIERWTSISELSTYVFTINVSLLTLWRCSRRESDARREFSERGRRKKDDDFGGGMGSSPLRLFGFGGRTERDSGDIERRQRCLHQHVEHAHSCAHGGGPTRGAQVARAGSDGGVPVVDDGRGGCVGVFGGRVRVRCFDGPSDGERVGFSVGDVRCGGQVAGNQGVIVVRSLRYISTSASSAV